MQRGATEELRLHIPEGILGQIAARKIEDLKRRRQAWPIEQLQAALQGALHESLQETIGSGSGDGRDFRSALAAPGLGLIAEFKPRSPSEGLLRPIADMEQVLQSYAPFAAAVSILCDQPFFGGSLELLKRARRCCQRPLLCKDFILSQYQLIEAKVMGADAILLIAALLPLESLRQLLKLAAELQLTALVEIHDQYELDSALEANAEVIGVNSRNLRTLQVDTDGALRLLEELPKDRIRIAESGINGREQLKALVGLADAVLIGSYLMKAADPAAAIESLGWPR